MSSSQILKNLKVNEQDLTKICKRYGIAKLYFFGSAVRGELNNNSDIDILYELQPNISLGFAINRLEDDLSKMFGREIDLISKKSLHELLQETVLVEAQEIYAA